MTNQPGSIKQAKLNQTSKHCSANPTTLTLKKGFRSSVHLNKKISKTNNVKYVSNHPDKNLIWTDHIKLKKKKTNILNKVVQITLANRKKIKDVHLQQTLPLRGNIF